VASLIVPGHKLGALSRAALEPEARTGVGRARRRARAGRPRAVQRHVLKAAGGARRVRQWRALPAARGSRGRVGRRRGLRSAWVATRRVPGANCHQVQGAVRRGAAGCVRHCAARHRRVWRGRRDCDGAPEPGAPSAERTCPIGLRVRAARHRRLLCPAPDAGRAGGSAAGAARRGIRNAAARGGRTQSERARQRCGSAARPGVSSSHRPAAAPAQVRAWAPRRARPACAQPAATAPLQSPARQPQTR
jgi:hypothetical protein